MPDSDLKTERDAVVVVFSRFARLLVYNSLTLNDR